MNLLNAELDKKNRAPVWWAMSELFLDSELDGSDFVYMAKRCAPTQYTNKNFEHILLKEVFPAFHENLIAVAGDWAGWSEEYVVNQVLCHQKKFTINFWKIRPFAWFFYRDVRRDWLSKVQPLIEIQRATYLQHSTVS
jgi:hypothetical protein